MRDSVEIPMINGAEGADAAAAIVAESVNASERDAAAAFVRLFYQHVPAADLRAFDPGTLAAEALSAFGFARRWAPGGAQVRAFNPTLADDGWRADHTIIEIVQSDMPFLVDSVTAELDRRGLTVHLIIHPVISLTHKDGQIVAAGERQRQPSDISVMQIHVDERTDPADLADIEAGIRSVFGSVTVAVADWREMRRRLAAAIEDLALHAPNDVDPAEVSESADFLAWLDDDHFTFLGYRDYATSGEGAEFRSTPILESGLGLLRADQPTSVTIGARIDSVPAQASGRQQRRNVVTVLKSSSRSPVHRPSQMDYVAIQRFDEAGVVIGERRFVGLFTSNVYTTSPKRIPLLRRKVAAIVERASAGRGSHDEKALTHILETYPRDELLQVEADALSEIARGVLNLQERRRTALFERRDAYNRFVSAMVYVPRDRYDTKLRQRFAAILSEAYGGEIVSFSTHIAEDPLARVHFIVDTPDPGAATLDAGVLEKRLRDASRSWSDKLETALVAALGEEAGLALFRRYGDAFPQSYQDATTAEMAAHDIGLMEARSTETALALDMIRPMHARPTEVHFKLFHGGAPAPLSDVLPMLEAMGLRILTETPNRIAPAKGAPVYLHYFEAEIAGGQTLDLRALRPAFLEGFSAAWHGETESDELNALLLTAGLNWRQVALLRAFSRYLRQAAAPFSVDYMGEALTRHPSIAALIIKYFEARFDPNAADAAKADAARAAALEALDAVSNLDEDRILRRFINLADAALRTNFWQRDAAGAHKPYLAIKFDSAKIDDLPLPRPMAEIFVFSPRMEGIHLRGGKVARGGIRWSDRREDFRTEILGLMKAQMVKNTVIVPVGAKGGFILKQAPTTGGRDAFLAEGVACYKILIRGMLDVTDNLVDGAIQPPADVVRADGDDPYIVAAADKGTATFSDIANGLSAEYGYWLGDAFASGGSAGYDHKKMGITARGAWESVKRMFLELGTDIQAEPFTVAGCGDMSGDVFGNGMLLSKQIKLVAAFNHQHIFIDPDPDPATSWAERKRMFDLPRSGWADYDVAALSHGGAIFDRSAKSITLSPEAQRALDAPKATLTPHALINIILKAPVDLLWFGGIGNYLKAQTETHQDAGDRANDAVRVDGAEVRAKVIGEGANLGVTQSGRVEFAQAGGRISTDFIDNSAGVDASDHEVNLKILLGRIVADGDMTGKQRDSLLAAMTEEVGTLILRNNYLQGQALSIAERDAPQRLADHERFMRSLERRGRLNRTVEYLPDEDEIDARESVGKGLTRPELAVLLSYAKLVLYDDLVASELPDDPGLQDRLLRYFPKQIRDQFGEQAARHQLGREITATIMTNEIVDRMGPTFATYLTEESGRPVSDVARAFAITVDTFGLKDLLAGVEALDGPGRMPLQAEMFGEIARLIRRATQWLLRRRSDLGIEAATQALRGPIQALADGLEDAMAPTSAANAAARTQRWIELGANADLARAVAHMDPIAAGLDIVHLSEDGHNLGAAAATYYSVGERLRLGWCRRNARGIQTTTGWDRQAVDALLEDFYGHQAEIARRALTAGGIEPWLADRSRSIERLDRALDDMASGDGLTLAMATVANSFYRGLSAS